jgi:nucleolysin TIA-1/TIAR
MPDAADPAAAAAATLPAADAPASEKVDPAAAAVAAAAATTLAGPKAADPKAADPKAAAAATLAPPPAATLQPQAYAGYPMAGYQMAPQMMGAAPMQHLRPAAPAGPVMIPFANAGTVKLRGLARDVNDYLLWMLFQTAGEVKNCRVIYDAMGQPTGEGMVDMADRDQGRRAIEALEGREIYGSVISCEAVAVKYATNEDTTNHQCLFVGNIGNEVDDHALHEFFVQLYPSCSSARIARDNKAGPADGRHAGYGFVTFRDKADADKAVENTGAQLGSRSLRIMHAKSQTVSAGRASSGGSSAAPPAVDSTLTVEQIAAQSESSNTTIYVAGAPTGLTEPVVRAHFKGFVPDQEPTEVRVFPDKQYCFVNYADHTVCARAIHTVNNTQLDGRPLRLSWGKMDSQRQRSTTAPPGVAGGAMMGGGMMGAPPGMMGGMGMGMGMGGGGGMGAGMAPGMMGGAMMGAPPGMMGGPMGGPPGMMGGGPAGAGAGAGYGGGNRYAPY